MDDWRLRELKTKIPLQFANETDEDYRHRVADGLLQKIDLALDYHGVPRGEPDTGWMLALALLQDVYPGFKPGKRTGVKPKPDITEVNFLLLGAVEVARQRNPKAVIVDIIRDLAHANGWPTGKKHIITLRRRYFRLKEAKLGDTPERTRVNELLKTLGPYLEERSED
jgi:hypothetical protein